MAIRSSTTTDIVVEYHAETVEFTDAVKAKVDTRLRKLARGHRDISGASVAINIVSGANRHQEYRARVVLYRRPSNVVAIRKDAMVSNAVLDAVEAIERQVRDQRERLRERSRNRRSV